MIWMVARRTERFLTFFFIRRRGTAAKIKICFADFIDGARARLAGRGRETGNSGAEAGLKRRGQPRCVVPLVSATLLL
ncbi:MAG: hypothetical protein MPL62_04025 [Alphaproteobacteria bacterium]|nr:hypothetical protein [Alphaproteobacteria bacterium]